MEMFGAKLNDFQLFLYLSLTLFQWFCSVGKGLAEYLHLK